MSVLKVGVVGAGRWGPNHLRNFMAMPGVQVVSIADTRQDLAQRIGANYPGIKCRSSHAEMLEKDDIDAVVVATPTSTHHEIVCAALSANKHVLCEKPLTSNGEKAWELVGMANSKRVTLMVGHVFLFNPAIEYLVSHVQSAENGRTYYMHAARTNLGPFRKDVNAAWDLASHDIYILNAVAGERPVQVLAAGGAFLQPSIEDVTFITLIYPSGAIGHIHASWLDPLKVRRITVVSEKKMITWDEFGTPGPIMIHDRSAGWDPNYTTYGEFQLLSREGDVTIPRIVMKEPLARQAEEFVARCMGKGDDFLAWRGAAMEGAVVVDVLEAATRSLSSKSVVEIRYGG